MTELSRRHLPTGVAAAALTPAFAVMPAVTASPPAGKQPPGFYRYKVGDIEVTVITDGANTFKFNDDHVSNKKREEINAALVTAYYQPDLLTTPYNPIVVNTAGKLVVFDTGPARRLTRALEATPVSFSSTSRPPVSIGAPSTPL